MTPNLKAFLDTIAFSELGPELLSASDNGYNVLVGSTPSNVKLFDNYDDHPRQLISLGRLGIKSTAAGRYQIKESIYDFYKVQLGLRDFSPESQDAIAAQLIRECHAMDKIEVSDDIVTAITECSSRWASFPGAGYGQHENKMVSLIEAFKAAGGVTEQLS